MTPSLLTDQLMGWVRAGMALPGDYRTLPRVSNSDLTRLKEEQLGGANGEQPTARWGAESASRFGNRAFGKAFHQHLLEPESVATVLEQLLPDLTHDRLMTDALGSSLATDDTPTSLTQTIRHDSFCRRYLRLAERDRVVLFTDPVTQVACKARLDLVYTSPKRHNALVLDFKTTSARTQAQFLQSCYDYDYDRQAAFYLDSLQHADSGEWDATRRFRFVLVGVTKQAPHRLFAVDATALPGFVDYGRKKYRFWLKKWQETNGLPD